MKIHYDIPKKQNTYMKKARRNILWSWHTVEVYWFKSDELYVVSGHLLLNKFNMREEVKESWISEAVYIRLSAGCYKWRGMFTSNKIMNAGIQAVLLKKCNSGKQWQKNSVKTELRKIYGSQNIFVSKQAIFSPEDPYRIPCFLEWSIIWMNFYCDKKTQKYHVVNPGISEGYLSCFVGWI